MTISHATGTGSRVSWGIDAWPPRPSSDDLQHVGGGKQRSDPAADCAVRSVGHDVERERCVGQRIEQPVVDHVSGAVIALFPRLKHKAHLAGQRLGASRRASARRRQASPYACRARRRASARARSRRTAGPVSSGIGSASMSPRSRTLRAGLAGVEHRDGAGARRALRAIRAAGRQAPPAPWPSVLGVSSPSSGSAWMARRSAVMRSAIERASWSRSSVSITVSSRRGRTRSPATDLVEERECSAFDAMQTVQSALPPFAVPMVTGHRPTEGLLMPTTFWGLFLFSTALSLAATFVAVSTTAVIRRLRGRTNAGRAPIR